MNLPLITILLSTYNRAHLIGETLNSIIAQTYTNWECIIIDDNSTDNTEKYLLENYLSKESRFIYYKKDLSKYKKGLGGSRNMGLDISKEKEFIHFFDDDDLMHSKKLELQLKPFTNDNRVDFVLCEYEHLNINNIDLINLKTNFLPIYTDNITEDFIKKNKNKINLNSCGPLWKRSFWGNKRFDEDLKTAEEYVAYSELFLSKKCFKYERINNLLFFYRKHDITNTGLRYKKNETLNTLNKADELIFDSIIKFDKLNYNLCSYYVKEKIIISFSYHWFKKINQVLKKVDFKNKNKIILIIKLFIFCRKLLLKII